MIRRASRATPALTAVVLLSGALRADERTAPEARGKATAVALNYCRAAFHRIRRYPSKRVLLEEQERILNNLDLNGIADEEVVQLYSAVLEEISQVEIADYERRVIREEYQRQTRRQLAAAVFAFGTHMASQQFVSAIRTGAQGWWDYRSLGRRRNLELWDVEKARMTAVVDKSSQFLDTFWKLARKRNIPDRWLVRDRDLDELEKAVRTEDAETRLRVLRRMEKFMVCYPPYWYYVARTQQQLGQLFAATESYQRMADVGDGHFRNDELLASGMANLAIVQDYLGQSGATRTARRALQYSTTVWQANLMCAAVLERAGKRRLAEDAILRNLDVDLEHDHSTACMFALYQRAGWTEKLAERLAHPEDVRVLSGPLLLKCCAQVGPRALPPAAKQHLQDTIRVAADLRIGRDDFVLEATPAWYLPSARVSVWVGEKRLEKPRLALDAQRHQLRFDNVGDWGGPLGRAAIDAPVKARFDYRDGTSFTLVFDHGAGNRESVAFAKRSEQTGAVVLPPRSDGLAPVAFTVGEQPTIALNSRVDVPPGKPRQPLPDRKSVEPPLPKPLQSEPPPESVADDESTERAPVVRPVSNE